MIAIYYNRKTGECFACGIGEEDYFCKTVFGLHRPRSEFDRAVTSGFVKIQQKGAFLDVTTFDDPLRM